MKRILLTIVATLLAACGQQQPPQQGGPPGPMPVTVAAAIEKPVAASHEFTARLEAVERVEVRGRVTGYIEAVHFKPGALVRKGDPLFSIDRRSFAAAVARSEAALAGARTRAEFAQKELARFEKLLSEKVVTQRDYDQRLSDARAAEAALQSAKAELDAARLDLSFAEVRSPIAGRASKAEITVGNLVQSGVPDAPILTTVVSQDPIYVTFEADESTYLDFAPRMAKREAIMVNVGVAGETGFPRRARLDFVDNRLDPATGTVRMRAMLANSDGTLTPGLSARVKLTDEGGKRNVVLVADKAIGTDQNKRFVFVVGGDKVPQYRPVKPGALVGALRVIEEGLKPGERVIVNGLQRVMPGMPVAPQAVGMESAAATPGGNGQTPQQTGAKPEDTKQTAVPDTSGANNKP
ncbi:MAG: efflux RND transporter periplasmic adaptor subunit [Pseudomonadota bacterium]